MNTHEVAIRIENLGKQYRIGEKQAAYRTIRESIANAAKAPVARAASLLRGQAYGAANLKKEIWALRGVSFEVRTGEVLGVIGRNGAGKTTLLKILTRITEPTEGSAEIRGRVGSLLEVGTGMHPELTGRENVYLNGAILGMRKAEIVRKFDEIIEFSGVEEFIDTPLKHYSSGMQVRLAFSIAAHLEPEILLVDEVLAVGDAEFQKKCMGKMEEVSKNDRTIFFVSHQLNSIRRLCDRCAWLENGQLRMLGPTAEVVSAYEMAVAGQSQAYEAAEGASTHACFIGWELVETGNEQRHVLTSDGPFTFKMVVKVNKPISKGVHGISLYSNDNQLIWGWAAYGLELDRGINEFVYALPTLPLRPGVYSWQVSLWEEESLLDLWHGIPELTVATEPKTHPRDEWSGILNIPCEFALRRPSDSYND